MLPGGPTTSILIRARSVVQVHPGPPFKSPVNTRLFSLFPFRGISIKNPFCQLFANFRIGRMALHSGALRPSTRNLRPATNTELPRNGTSGPPTPHGIRTTLPMVRRLERASNASFTWERGNELLAKSFSFPWAIRLRSSGTHSPICSGRSVGMLNPMRD